jgi:hypothetical protein
MVEDGGVVTVCALAMGISEAKMRGIRRLSSDRMPTIISSSKEVPANQRRGNGKKRGQRELKGNIGRSLLEQRDECRHPDYQPRKSRNGGQSS